MDHLVGQWSDLFQEQQGCSTASAHGVHSSWKHSSVDLGKATHLLRPPSLVDHTVFQRSHYSKVGGPVRFRAGWNL